MDFKLFCILLAVSCFQSTSTTSPNIIFMMADDLGWGDVSYLGSDQIYTPNLDSMAAHGIILSNYYTNSEGTPSRSEFFTGKYAMRFGGQGASIAASEDRGIPEAEYFLPCYLKELGYATHLVGKWQLGKSRTTYWPTNRGFDTFYGFPDGSTDHWTYNHIENWSGKEYYGLNLYSNLEPVEDQTGYLTDILSDRAVQVIREHNTSIPLYLHYSHAAPHAGGGLVNLQTPSDYITPNEHILHSARRLYAGMVTCLDKSLGYIAASLAEKNMLNNTLIVFVSDNGAAPEGASQNFGSNLPLRGIKGTPWEGAVRSPAVLWHAAAPSRVIDELFHVTDWVPTLVTAAGGTISRKLDGVSQWDVIMKNNKTKRKEVLITLDDQKGIIAYRDNDFKIIMGDVDKDASNYHGINLKEFKPMSRKYENALLEAEMSRVLKETLGLTIDIDLALDKRNKTTLPMPSYNNQLGDLCIPTRAKGCLYNIATDPTEANDLWDQYPELIKRMTLRLRTLWSEMTPSIQRKSDERADPSRRNYIWGPWLDDSEKLQEPPMEKPAFPSQLSAGEMQYLVEVNMKSLSENINIYFKSMTESLYKAMNIFKSP